MIVVDTLARIAILFGEPKKQAFENVIASGERCVMSAVNAHEMALVLRVKRGAAAVERFWRFLTDSEIEIVPFDEAQVHAASAAFDLYGKGVHPAALNLSDCAAYALAKAMNAPLLFKGEDFTQTDLQSRL